MDQRHRNNQLDAQRSALTKTPAGKAIEQESVCLLGGKKKSPVKYSYLSTQEWQQQRREWSIFWLECFAMFIFIYASTCSHQSTGIDLHFFVGIMIAIPICAKQTGANLNPAVTLSMAFKAGQPFTYQTLLWIYVKAQLLGAVLAMVLALGLNDVYREPITPSLSPANVKFDGVPYGLVIEAILSEALGMFILIFFILYGTGPYSFIPTAGAKYFYIAVFVYIGRKFAASSGNQINIALTLSQAFVGMLRCNFTGFYYALAWLLGDLMGVILASLLYLKLVEPSRQFLLSHQTAKVMNQLKRVHESELKDGKGIDSNQFSPNEFPDYYKKLQYF